MLAADAEGCRVWNVGEVTFTLADQRRLNLALPGETPTIVEQPQKGWQSCSVIAACCVQTGELLFETVKELPVKEDVVRVVTPFERSRARTHARRALTRPRISMHGNGGTRHES